MNPQITVGTAFGIVILSLLVSGLVAATLLLGLQPFVNLRISLHLFSIFVRSRLFFFLPCLLFSSKANK